MNEHPMRARPSSPMVDETPGPSGPGGSFSLDPIAREAVRFYLTDLEGRKATAPERSLGVRLTEREWDCLRSMAESYLALCLRRRRDEGRS